MESRKRRMWILIGLAGFFLVIVWIEYGSSERKLLKQIESSDPAQRFAAIRGLEEIGSVRAVAAITARMQDPDASVASRAIIALGVMGRKGQVAEVEKVAGDKRTEAREAAAVALGRSPQSVTVNYQVLINLVANDPSPIVRAESALSLGRRGAREAVPALIIALNDPDLNVRQRAVQGLRMITKGRFEYSPIASPDERAGMIEQIQTWWNSESTASK